MPEAGLEQSVSGEIGLGEEPLDAVELRAEDLGLGCPAEDLGEPSFKDAPGKESCARTSSTVIPSQACSRMKWTAEETVRSSMARTSVDSRVTTPSGGIVVTASGACSPLIICSSSEAASKPDLVCVWDDA